MRTFRVELTIPVEGVGDTQVTVSTEVFAEDNDACTAGEEARTAIDQFIEGYAS